MYGRNSDKGGDLTDVGASAIGRAINKEFNLMDAGCWPLHKDKSNRYQGRVKRLTTYRQYSCQWDTSRRQVPWTLYDTCTDQFQTRRHHTRRVQNNSFPTHPDTLIQQHRGSMSTAIWIFYQQGSSTANKNCRLVTYREIVQTTITGLLIKLVNH